MAPTTVEKKAAELAYLWVEMKVEMMAAQMAETTAAY